MLAEALAAGVAVESVFVAPGAPGDLVSRAAEGGAVVHEVPAAVLDRVAGTVTPQGVLAVVPTLDVGLDTLRHATFVVVCVDVRDPGNAGTILRSAEAAGAHGVVCCGGSVDVYNPKTVRASAGSLFHVPVVAGGDPVEVLERMGSWGLRRFGAVAGSGRDHTSADLTGPTALVLGNEATGLPRELDLLLDERVSIPMAGRSESLNVGMAAAVLCFEAARQRRTSAP